VTGQLLVSWKGFGRKSLYRLWVAWSDIGRRRKPSVRIAGDPPEIATSLFLNVSQKHYPFSQPGFIECDTFYPQSCYITWTFFVKKLLVNMWSELKLRIWSNSKIISTKWLEKESFLQATQPFPAAKKSNISTWNSSLSCTQNCVCLFFSNLQLQNWMFWHNNRYMKIKKYLRSYLYCVITK